MVFHERVAGVRQASFSACAGKVSLGVFTLGNWWLGTRGMAGSAKTPTVRRRQALHQRSYSGRSLMGSLSPLSSDSPCCKAVSAWHLLSNLPEGISSSSGLRIAGWPMGEWFESGRL